MTDLPTNDLREDDEIDLGELFGLLYARKFTIIFLSSLAVMVGVAFALISKPVYQADALLQLEEKSGGMALSADLSGLFAETPLSVAEIEILKSRMVLGKVVQNLSLDIRAEPKRLPIIGDFLTRFRLERPDWNAISNYAWSEESITVGYLSVPNHLVDRPITLSSLGGSSFSVETGDGITAEGEVGEVLTMPEHGISIYVSSLKANSGREFSLTKLSLAVIVAQLRSNLTISEKGKNSSILQLTYKSSDPAESAEVLDNILEVYLAQNLDRNSAEAESSLNFLKEQLPEAQEQVRIAEDALSVFRSGQRSVDLSFETRSILEQSVALENQLNELALEEQELQKRYTTSHPLYQTLLDNRQQLEDRLAEVKSQSNSLPETQQEMLGLSQNLEVAQQVYLQLLNRTQELSVIKAGTIGNVRVIDEAEALSKPVAPNKKMIVLLAGVLGLVASVGLILLQSLLIKGVQSVDEIEKLGLPVYSTIPRVGNGEYGKTFRKQVRHILAKKDPTNLAVESLRSLRTSLHFGLMDSDSSLLMVTSSIPGEGKSFVSVNLATVVAQSGQNTCLVDVDLRRGFLNHYFKTKRGEPGLSEVLSGTVSIEDAIYKDEQTGLHFIPAGNRPPNPSELLMHERFGDVVNYLNDRFDLTILDTPPILAVTDSMIVGKYAGMSLLVVQHDTTRIAEVKNAQKTFALNNISLSGAVLNSFDMKKNASKYGARGAIQYYSYETRKT